ncbi:hypothetical protein BZL30_6512 [Mycobacterium kansasii]|uniref:Uncharacterized protein n=1 Tax=Mycobacterium kansasii TaxID=1768 RepID=A0A1V3WTQ0_MYCKA|nr:hypothetical protein BZL30_6512 [Mycobacterium kansasii]
MIGNGGAGVPVGRCSRWRRGAGGWLYGNGGVGGSGGPRP